MFILKLIIELAIDAYSYLGFGTKEYRIERKVEKLSKEYPEVIEHYMNNKSIFHTDEQLGKLIIHLNMKKESEKEKVALFIKQRFNMAY